MRRGCSAVNKKAATAAMTPTINHVKRGRSQATQDRSTSAESALGKIHTPPPPDSVAQSGVFSPRGFSQIIFAIVAGQSVVGC